MYGKRAAMPESGRYGCPNTKPPQKRKGVPFNTDGIRISANAILELSEVYFNLENDLCQLTI